MRAICNSQPNTGTRDERRLRLGMRNCDKIDNYYSMTRSKEVGMTVCMEICGRTPVVVEVRDHSGTGGGMRCGAVGRLYGDRDPSGPGAGGVAGCCQTIRYYVVGWRNAVQLYE